MIPTLDSTRRPISLAAVVGALLFSAALLAQAPARPPAEPLTVMSFNIRLGTANDGDNHWTRRRDMLFDVLRVENADLVGLQEAFRFQIDEILAAVPLYAVTGREGPDHEPVFTVELSVPGFDPVRAAGRSKQAAERAAASQFLVREGIWPEPGGAA